MNAPPFPLRVSRVWVLAAIIGALVLVPSAVHLVRASAGSPGIAVIGDSITARYNDDDGSPRQAWWSFVGHHFGLQVTTYAQSGSGFLRPGLNCTGNTFRQRLEELRKHPPAVVLVEGGRNDWVRCRDGYLELANDTRIRRSVDSFLTDLQGVVPPRTPIFVLGPPWGSADAAQRDRVTAIVRSEANRHRMTFIDTDGVFDVGRHTFDGVHPTLVGSRALGMRVIDTIGASLPLKN